MTGLEVLREYYELSIEERLERIRFISSENKVLQGIREKNHDKWRIVELCKEIMFENVKMIEYYQKGIENDREATPKSK